MDEFHSDSANGETKTVDISSAQATCGLGNLTDMTEVFQQVRQFMDVIYPAQTGLTTPQRDGNRHDLAVNVRAKANYTLTHNMNAGVIFGQVYVCKARSNICVGGSGVGSKVNPGEIITSNMNSKYLPDYGDAAGWGITGGQLDNTNTQAKPTVAATDHWTTPFMVPEFTRNYKVLKVHKFALPPGGNFMFSIKLPLKRIQRINYKESQAVGAGNIFWLGKWNRSVFIRFHGEPSVDKTDGSSVNYCAASLNGVIDKKYEFSYSHQPSQSFITQATSLLGTVTSTAKNVEGEADLSELLNP